MAEFIVYTCKRCGHLTKGILEAGGATPSSEQGPGVCSECLDVMFGVEQETGNSQQRSDDLPKA